MKPGITTAVKSGPTPTLVDFHTIVEMYNNGEDLTRGQQVVAFCSHLIVPEGPKVGLPLELEDFQVAFILAVFDNPVHTRQAILSVARRNGKTFLMSVILLAYLVGPLSKQNTVVASAAQSRDQAALTFRMMRLMLLNSPDMQGLYSIVPSKKHIVGLKHNVEYFAVSSDAKTGFGQSLKVVLLDEAGQIRGPNNDFVDMLDTSQGSHDDALFLTISTQAPSDADYLSIKIDTAEREKDPSVVCHVYAAEDKCELQDQAQWHQANPGLGVFRSIKDMTTKMQDAALIPSKEAGARNLLLNQRIALESLWLAPAIWSRGSSKPDLDVFRCNPVCFGLDLSARNDLTAAVAAAKDPDTGTVHVIPFVFCPSQGIEDRARRDKTPYDVWVRDGLMHAIGGSTVDYSQIAHFLMEWCENEGWEVSSVNFDRWRIDIMKAAADEAGFASFAEWVSVGQGFKDISPRCETWESLLLEDRLCHGDHPLLRMAASNAIAVKDPAGNIKLDKSKSTLRIDPLIAAVMAVHPLESGELSEPFNVDALMA